MDLIPYTTSGGKDLIKEYIDDLPKDEKARAFQMLVALERDGFEALELFNTRQLMGKLYEIKFPRHNRIMYVIIDSNSIFLAHACQKQKNKAEKIELKKAIERVREFERETGKKLL